MTSILSKVICEQAVFFFFFFVKVKDLLISLVACSWSFATVIWEIATYGRFVINC